MRNVEEPGKEFPARAPDPPPQEVLDKLKEALDKLPEHVRVSVLEAASFSGPLPPPTMYREYENVLAGSAERILAMAEKEQDHRTTWETTALSASRQETKRGQWFGFAIAVACIGAAMVLAAGGHEVVAGIALGASAVGLVGRFLGK